MADDDAALSGQILNVACCVAAPSLGKIGRDNTSYINDVELTNTGNGVRPGLAEAGYQVAQIGHAVRFGEDEGNAAPLGFLRVNLCAPAGDEREDQRWPALMHPIGEVPSAHARAHAHVADDQVERTALLEQLQSFLGRGRLDDLVALQAQHHVDHRPESRLVINHQHPPRSSRQLWHGGLGRRRSCCALRHGERQAERRTPIWGRVEGKLSAVASHDPRYLSQTQACAVFALSSPARITFEIA